MLKANLQSNSIREIYEIKGDSFDTMLHVCRGGQDLAMAIYIAYLKDKNQPLFIDKTARVQLIGQYTEGIRYPLQICENEKKFTIDDILRSGKKLFEIHDEEIDKKEMEKSLKEETKN